MRSLYPVLSYSTLSCSFVWRVALAGWRWLLFHERVCEGGSQQARQSVCVLLYQSDIHPVPPCILFSSGMHRLDVFICPCYLTPAFSLSLFVSVWFESFSTLNKTTCNDVALGVLSAADQHAFDGVFGRGH